MSGRKEKRPGYMFFGWRNWSPRVPKLECKRSWTRDPILQAPGTDTASEENRHQSEGITCHLPTMSLLRAPKSQDYTRVLGEQIQQLGEAHCVHTIASNTREERGWTRLLQPRRVWISWAGRITSSLFPRLLPPNEPVLFTMRKSDWKKEALYSGQVALLDWNGASVHLQVMTF